MSALAVLIRGRLSAAINGARQVRHESTFKIVVVAVLATGFWLGLFGLFNEAFGFLRDHAQTFHRILVDHIFSLFFMTLGLMLVFSNAIISFGTLFKSPETAFLFPLPIRVDTIYVYRMIESLVFSSWAFMALGLPLLLAYGIQNDAPWHFYPSIAAFLVPFVILPAATGTLLGLLLTASVPRHRGKALAAIAGAALVLGVLLAIEVARIRSGRWMLTDEAVARILGKLNFTQSPAMPNFWISRGLLSVADGDFSNAIFFLLTLTANALFAVGLGYFLAGSLYQLAYSASHGASSIIRYSSYGLIDRLAKPFFRRYPVMTVLILKDAKAFLRDPVQWSQVLIFFGLLCAYIANLRNFSYDLDHPFFRNLIGFLNLGATCLTMATITSRFIFPLVSLEGPRFWVIGLVPITRKKILLAKFLFALFSSLLIVEALVFLSNLILRADRFMFLLQGYTAALVCVGLTGLTVGMGALFPNFRERNPSKIVSGFGGTLTLILSVFLVMAVVFPEGIICHFGVALPPEHSMSRGHFHFWLATCLVGVTILTFACAYIPMRLGIKALDRMEF